MDGSRLKERWICEYCSPDFEDADVVPDLNSLVEEVKKLGIKYELPETTITKPKVHKLPSAYSNIEDTWICSCHIIFTEGGIKHELNVKVYLDYEAFLRKQNVSIEFEDDIPNLIKTNSMELVDNIVNPEYMNESRFHPDVSHILHDAYSFLHDEVNSNSNLTTVSQMGVLHNCEAIITSDTGIDQDDTITYHDMDDDIDKMIDKAMINGSFDDNMYDYHNESSNFEDIQRVFDEANALDAGSRRGRKKNNNDELEEIVGKLLNFPRENIIVSLPKAVEAQPIEVIDLSSDDEEKDDTPVTKRRRIARHKDFDILDLDDIGLGAERDNFLRSGEMASFSACVYSRCFNTADDDHWFEFKKFRMAFRKKLQERVAARNITEKEIENLEGLVASRYDRIRELRIEQEILESSDAGKINNPYENTLLLFKHQQKCHGMSVQLSQGIMSHYKEVLLAQEIALPAEWSDDLVNTDWRCVTKSNMTQKTENFISKLSKPFKSAVQPVPDGNVLNEIITIQQLENVLNNTSSEINFIPQYSDKVLQEVPIASIKEGNNMTKDDGEAVNDLFFDI